MTDLREAPVWRTLSDPTRRALYERIVQAGEVTVGRLAEGSAVSQPAVSQHLKVLRDAGLIAERREGRRVHYRPEPAGLAPLVDWIATYGVFWRERFANLRTLLSEIDRGDND
jgi:DNA-binding transcriptional ArsR family regulator